jgi:hypothetical protein
MNESVTHPRRRRQVGFALPLLLALLLTSCVTAPVTEVLVRPGEVVASGDRALELVTEFVQRFPDRASGMPQNAAAAAWLEARFVEAGLTCRVDRWEVVNYSRVVPMQNVVCELPGTERGQIVLVAHIDQSPATVEGADNDGSGIGVLLHLAEVFVAEPDRRYGLVFLASDGEEYGMLGTRRFLETHVDTGRLIAGISLDNVGKWFYRGVDLDPRGQFRGYGALWFQLLVRDAAVAVGETPAPRVYGLLDQVLGQAVPISFMDEGPLVAAGVPAVGLAGTVPAEFAALHYDTYHSPGDTLELQAAGPLGHTGRVAEAAVRQLQAMTAFPAEAGPFLFFEGSNRAWRGWSLALVVWGLVAGFALAGAWLLWRAARAVRPAWRSTLVHLASLWLPLVGAVALLYGFVAVGLLDRFELYPATPKDPVLTTPQWPAIVLWLVALAVLFGLGRWAARSLAGADVPSPRLVKGASLLVVAVASAFVAATVPLALLFVVPLLAWFAIGGRRGWGRVADVAALLAGGLVVYALFYFMGFAILRIDFAIFWYLLMMFSIGTVSFAAALVIMGLVAAGLAMVVPPARPLPVRVRAPAGGGPVATAG